MPYNSEKIPIAGTKLDNRIKLLPSQKEAVIQLSKEGYSQRQIAEMFHVSRRLIQSILSPATRQKSKPKSYSKEYWREVKRKYRARKQNLYKNGKIKAKKAEPQIYNLEKEKELSSG